MGLKFRVVGDDAATHSGQLLFHYGTHMMPVPVSQCRIALRKVSLSRQFTGKNPPSPGRSYNGETFCERWADDIVIKRRHIKSVIISPRANISWGNILM